jgi:hypothetical protein
MFPALKNTLLQPFSFVKEFLLLRNVRWRRRWELSAVFSYFPWRRPWKIAEDQPHGKLPPVREGVHTIPRITRLLINQYYPNDIGCFSMKTTESAFYLEEERSAPPDAFRRELSQLTCLWQVDLRIVLNPHGVAGCAPLFSEKTAWFFSFFLEKTILPLE